MLIILLFFTITSYASNYTIEIGKTKYFYGPNNSAIFFEASDPTVIKLTPKSVDSNGKWTLEVAGLKQGMSMFYFSYYNSDGKKVNETHTIEVIDINSIKIPETLSLTIGDKTQISPVILDSRMKSYLLEWHSSNEAVATIDNDYTQNVTKPGVFGYITEYVRGGNIVANQVGTTKIYCTYKGLSSGICDLTVFPIYVTNIDFDEHNIKVIQFETINVTAHILPENATNKTLKWESSDPNIAFIDNKGNITGLKPGKVMISATTEDGSQVSSSFILEVLETAPTDTICHEVNLYIDNYVQFSYPIEDGKPYSVNINTPGDDWSIRLIQLNGINDIANLHENTYTIEKVDKPLEIKILFEFNRNVEIFDMTTTGFKPTFTNFGVKICKDNGNVMISNLAIGSKIKIYTIGGLLVGDFDSSSNECIINLDSGTYLISVESDTYPSGSFKIKI